MANPEVCSLLREAHLVEASAHIGREEAQEVREQPQPQLGVVLRVLQEARAGMWVQRVGAQLIDAGGCARAWCGTKMARSCPQPLAQWPGEACRHRSFRSRLSPQPWERCTDRWLAPVRCAVRPPRWPSRRTAPRCPRAAPRSVSRCESPSHTQAPWPRAAHRGGRQARALSLRLARGTATRGAAVARWAILAAPIPSPLGSARAGPTGGDSETAGLLTCPHECVRGGVLARLAPPGASAQNPNRAAIGSGRQRAADGATRQSDRRRLDTCALVRTATLLRVSPCGGPGVVAIERLWSYTAVPACPRVSWVMRECTRTEQVSSHHPNITRTGLRSDRRRADRVGSTLVRELQCGHTTASMRSPADGFSPLRSCEPSCEAAAAWRSSLLASEQRGRAAEKRGGH